MSKTYRLGCDIGGTFTDFILLDEDTGEAVVEKCLTTPEDPSEAVEQGVRNLATIVPGYIANLKNVIHGTTLIINAIIERKGVKTGLIATKGFRDVLELRRELRYDAYDMLAEFPPPLVPRNLRKEVTERVFYDGRIYTDLQVGEVKEVLLELLNEGVESIAVCFLHSYANPSHEQEVGKIIQESYPDLAVSLSSDVIPKIGEYERTSTTVANAYVKPLIKRYLVNLLDRLRALGFKGDLFVMLSSGGIASMSTAVDYPIRIIESGPVAGTLAAKHFAEMSGFKNIFPFDMGGTTAKSCLVEKGEVSRILEYEIARAHTFKPGSGIPLVIPVINTVEVGTGGGSIAEVDALGLLKVGPVSAGADPGPMCYSRGGKKPTVTDADLILGYLNPNYFLGGKMRLDVDAARAGIEEQIAKPLKVSVPKAAWGIHNIANENMAAAGKMLFAERGLSPKEFTLFAFGGAGPVHAIGLARKLGISKIMVPIHAGVFSAKGFFVTPIAFDAVKSYKVSLSAANFDEMEQVYHSMEKEARDIIMTTGIEKEATITYRRAASMRYIGQELELKLEFPANNFSRLYKRDVLDMFNKRYQELYGYVCDAQLGFLDLYLSAEVPIPVLATQKLSGGTKSHKGAIKGTRRAYSGEEEAYIDFTIYDRYELPPGAHLNGPAIVEEKETTVVIGRGASASIDNYGTMLINLQ